MGHCTHTPHEFTRDQDDSGSEQSLGWRGCGERSGWGEGRHGRQMAKLGSKVAVGLPCTPRSASPACTAVRVSACGCGHAPGKGEAGAEHPGQELTSHLLIQAAERASCCHRGQLSARIRQPAVSMAHPRVTNQRLHLPPASKCSRGQLCPWPRSLWKM